MALRTLADLRADHRVTSVEYCQHERRYFVGLADGWKDDDCRAFSAATVRGAIDTLNRCTPADPDWDYDLGRWRT